MDQIPLHGHPIRLSNASDDGSGNGGLIMREPGGVLINFTFTGTPSNTHGEQLGGTGGRQSHSHSFTGNAMDFAVQFVDTIIATVD